MKKSALIVSLLMVMFAAPAAAWAGEPGVDTGDTSFILTATALVLLMTPGLAIFYAGMVRRKNALSTAMQSFIMICLISVQWVLIGYSIAFGPDKMGLFGNLSWAGLGGRGDKRPRPGHPRGAGLRPYYLISTPVENHGWAADAAWPSHLPFHHVLKS